MEAASKLLRINDLGGHFEESSPHTPFTPATPINLDGDDTPTFEAGGIVRRMGRKTANKKAKAEASNPVVEVLSKELSILGSTKAKDSDTFAKFVEAKTQHSKEALAIRDRQLRLKELKYEDWVLSLDISGMCPEDQAQYMAMKEAIRSRYRQSSSSSHNLD